MSIYNTCSSYVLVVFPDRGRKLVLVRGFCLHFTSQSIIGNTYHALADLVYVSPLVSFQYLPAGPLILTKTKAFSIKYR